MVVNHIMPQNNNTSSSTPANNNNARPSSCTYSLLVSETLDKYRLISSSSCDNSNHTNITDVPCTWSTQQTAILATQAETGPTTLAPESQPQQLPPPPQQQRHLSQIKAQASEAYLHSSPAKTTMPLASTYQQAEQQQRSAETAKTSDTSARNKTTSTNDNNCDEAASRPSTTRVRRGIKNILILSSSSSSSNDNEYDGANTSNDKEKSNINKSKNTSITFPKTMTTLSKSKKSVSASGSHKIHDYEKQTINVLRANLPTFTMNPKENNVCEMNNNNNNNNNNNKQTSHIEDTTKTNLPLRYTKRQQNDTLEGPKRKRGRPPKNHTKQEVVYTGRKGQDGGEQNSMNHFDASGRKRGRPPKNLTKQEVVYARRKGQDGGEQITMNHFEASGRINNYQSTAPKFQFGLENAPDKGSFSSSLEGTLDYSPLEPAETCSEIDSTEDAKIGDPNSVGNFEDWSKRWEVKFRDIERISVVDPDVRQKVSERRQYGVPVIITNHLGWAQFAKRWLVEVNESIHDSASEQSDAVGRQDRHDGDASNNLLDLSKNHYIDVKAMIADIGNESVPVIRKNYNERNPIQSTIKVETFLRTCWPSRDEIDKKVTTKKRPLLYLHQWQFPLSQTAGRKLTGTVNNYPLPNSILGDDLLRYWRDKDKCNHDSPYQYLFMGREGTRSKLHRDNGGLLITIAPIIGSKEVTLVHRDEGAGWFHLHDANIDQPDFNRFPLMHNIRAWRTELKPGEILLMPEGTYHQCKNLTACLSYHRLFLDTLNLKAFLKSYLYKDAPEIEHDEVIWNAASELTDRVNAFIEDNSESLGNDVPKNVQAAVDALCVLRHISRFLALREEPETEEKRKKSWVDKKYSWSSMVSDIDVSLQDFHCRLRL